MNERVEILPGYFACGLTLHIPSQNAIAFSDVHLGFEGALNRDGVLVPGFQYAEIVRLVREALKEAKPEKVIIDGDLKHEFGGVSGREWAEVLGFLDVLSGYEVTLVRGNHDRVMGPVNARGGVKLADELRLGTTLFVHGDRLPRRLGGFKTVVIGHEHPCVGLREGQRVEKVKCFLVGEWEGRDLIVLPSMNLVTEGTDLLEEPPLSPLLGGDIGRFKAYGVEEGRILYFGRLRDIP
jgi:uncharacterized protein